MAFNNFNNQKSRQPFAICECGNKTKYFCDSCNMPICADHRAQYNEEKFSESVLCFECCKRRGLMICKGLADTQDGSRSYQMTVAYSKYIIDGLKNIVDEKSCE